MTNAIKIPYDENSLDTRLGQTWVIARGLHLDISKSPHAEKMLPILRDHTDVLRGAIMELIEGCDGALRSGAKEGPEFLLGSVEVIDTMHADTEKETMFRISAIQREMRQIQTYLLVMRQCADAAELSREMKPIGFLTEEDTERRWSGIYDRINPYQSIQKAYDASAEALFFNTASGWVHPLIANRCRAIVIAKHADMQGEMNEYMGTPEWRGMHDNLQNLIDLDPFKLAKAWEITAAA